MPSPSFYNSCWMRWCSQEVRAYRRDSRQPHQIQAQLLRRIVSRNQGTWFGTKHQFSRITDVKLFQRKVPLTGYDDYREPIDRIMLGEASILTSDHVELLEPTSGSTSAEKLIPYTAGLRREFQRAIRVWIGDLFSGRPAVRRGYAYWSLSPLAHEKRVTPSGIPIGFDDDASYLGNVERLLLANCLAVPPTIAECKSLESAFYTTFFFLLRCPQLSLVSVWSPTFLSGMFHLLHTRAEQLCDDVDRGVISAEVPVLLSRAFEPRPARADHLRATLLRPKLNRNWVRDIWPGLALVSCWTDGPSSMYAAQLQKSLAGIEIQPKGLLSTEAFVSIPLLGCAGAGLAIRSHFFEFQPVDSAGEPHGETTHLAHELDMGGVYRVVVTTSGGLYRYQTMDEVKVVGFYNQVPLLRFVGKCDRTSDLVGEKLHAAFVHSVLDRVFTKLGISPRSAELVAQRSRQPYYLLRLIDERLSGNLPLCEQLRAQVEDALRANPQYSYAVDIGQLGGLQITSNGVEQESPGSQIISPDVREQLHHGNKKPSILISPADYPGKGQN